MISVHGHHSEVVREVGVKTSDDDAVFVQFFFCGEELRLLLLLVLDVEVRSWIAFNLRLPSYFDPCVSGIGVEDNVLELGSGGSNQGLAIGVAFCIIRHAFSGFGGCPNGDSVFGVRPKASQFGLITSGLFDTWLPF